MKNVSCQCQQN